MKEPDLSLANQLTRAYHKRYYSELIPDAPDWVHEQLIDEACDAQARLYDEIETSEELGDELLTERVSHQKAKEEWLAFANEREALIAEVRAERDGLRIELSKLKIELASAIKTLHAICDTVQHCEVFLKAKSLWVDSK